MIPSIPDEKSVIIFSRIRKKLKKMEMRELDIRTLLAFNEEKKKNETHHILNYSMN